MTGQTPPNNNVASAPAKSAQHYAKRSEGSGKFRSPLGLWGKVALSGGEGRLSRLL